MDCAILFSYFLNDRCMDKTILSLWRSHNNDQVVRAPIIHVAGAVTDTDDTYGAYVAAKTNTFHYSKRGPPTCVSVFRFLFFFL